MELIVIENWTGGKGSVLVTKQHVSLKEGDNYISEGLSGQNIFTCYGKDVGRMAQKIIAKTPDLDWQKSGNNTLMRLQSIVI